MVFAASQSQKNEMLEIYSQPRSFIPRRGRIKAENTSGQASGSPAGSLILKLVFD